MTSKELKIEDAIEKIQKMKSEQEIVDFTVDDERKPVLAAANARIKEIGQPKQGEVKEPITKDTHDFKEGVQKTKNDSGPSQNTAGKQAGMTTGAGMTKDYVTCEDVIENMRKQGRKI